MDQASPSFFCILQVITNLTVRRPGTKASLVLLADHNLMHMAYLGWAYFQEESTLCNNFIQERVVV